MKPGKQVVQQLLAEAHASETAQIQTLTAHIAMTPPGEYRRGLETHLRETRGHEQKVRRRLEEVGFRRNPIQMGMGVAQNVVKNAIVMTKAPVDMVRGKTIEEKLVRNARDEATSEALEIATYDTIETVARNIGDNETAELAVSIRADEEKMLDALRGQIPELAGAMVREMVPSHERSVTGPGDLPIAGYDEKTADEVIERLRDLSQEDLKAVEAYESKNANRSTVLKRIEALRTQEPWPGYDSLTVAEVKQRLTGAPEARLQKVREYERSHKNRTSVIDLTERESASV